MVINKKENFFTSCPVFSSKQCSI